MSGHIYLIRTREFIALGQPIYKIGKTGQDGLKRAKQYSKDSVIEIHLRVDNHHEAEVALIKSFKLLFKHRADIGTESFEGDRNAMIAEICRYNILTSIGPPATEQKMDTADDTPLYPVIDHSVSIASLGQLFYSIYSSIHTMMNNYAEHSMRSIYAVHNVNRIIETIGHPGLRPDEAETIIDMDKMLTDMKKTYSKPGPSKQVATCHYQKYVGVHNVACRLIEPVARYMAARAKMPEPGKWIGVKLKSPMLEVDQIAFNLMVKKCHDFAQNGHSYSWYPR